MTDAVTRGTSLLDPVTMGNSPPNPVDLRAEVAALAGARGAPAVPELPHLRAAAVATWRGRMVNEYLSAEVFEALATQLGEAGFEAAEVSACRGFAEEERRHGVLCGMVATVLGGEARAPRPERAPFPRHRDVAAREGALRNLLSVCCLSETVAVALIGAERLEMPDGPLRALLTEIYADEVGHARYGWRVLEREVPTLPPPARDRLAGYLAVALRHLEAHELAHLPLHGTPPPEGAALGLCDGADARALFHDTVATVICPALAGLGLHVSSSRARR